MRYWFLILCSLELISCKGVNRLINGPENPPTNSPILSTDYTISGVTTENTQIIQPIRIEGSTIVVSVKRPGMSTFEICNSYEYKVYTQGAGGGGIQFGKIVYASYSHTGSLISLTLTTDAVAPIGTEYRIESKLNT